MIVLVVVFAPLFFLMCNAVFRYATSASPESAWRYSERTLESAESVAGHYLESNATNECADQLGPSDEGRVLFPIYQFDDKGQNCLLGEFRNVPAALSEGHEDGQTALLLNIAYSNMSQDEADSEESTLAVERDSVFSKPCADVESGNDSGGSQQDTFFVLRIILNGADWPWTARYLFEPCAEGIKPSQTSAEPSAWNDLFTFIEVPSLMMFRPLRVHSDTKQLSLEFFEKSKEISDLYRGSGWDECPKCAQTLELDDDAKRQFESAFTAALNPFLNRSYIRVDSPGASVCTQAECQSGLAESFLFWQLLNGPDASGFIQFAIFCLSGLVLGLTMYRGTVSKSHTEALRQEVASLRSFTARSLKATDPSAGSRRFILEKKIEHLERCCRELPSAQFFALRDSIVALVRGKGHDEARDAALVQLGIAQESSAARYRLIEVLVGLILPIGFLGTVIGISAAMGGVDGMLADAMSTKQRSLTAMSANMKSAFFTTAIALMSFIVIAPFVGLVQRREEARRNLVQSNILDFIKYLQYHRDTENAEVFEISERPDLEAEIQSPLLKHILSVGILVAIALLLVWGAHGLSSISG